MTDHVFVNKLHGFLVVGKKIFMKMKVNWPYEIDFKYQTKTMDNNFDCPLGWAVFEGNDLIGMTTDEWMLAEFEDLGNL